MPQSKEKNNPCIYIHIPFCLKACPYCNFNFRLIRNYQPTFVVAYGKALLQEWQHWCEQWTEEPLIRSLYLGGGTPSLLAPDQIDQIITGLLKTSKEQEAVIEITLEANPEDFRGSGAEKLKELRKAGVNRLSLGAQSLNEETLKQLGRNHRPIDVKRVVENAREIGFDNISLDIIGGAPKQNLSMLKNDLEKFIELNPEHISYYGLTVEEKTPFYSLDQQNRLSLPTEDIQVEMFCWVRDQLRAHGYEHYEISNYSKPGFSSLHNRGYWEYQNYIGLGAGAHSFLRENGNHHRMMNIRDPEKYVQKIQKDGFAHEFKESIQGKRALGEFIFTGLRSRKGVSLTQFQEVFSLHLPDVFSNELEEHFSNQWLEIYQDGEDQRLRLTEKGVLFSDSVFEAFVS